LHAGAFPEIRFRSRDIVSLGHRRYEVTGDLTIREITRDVALTVDELPPRPPAPSHQPDLTFVAHATINRQEFGLHWNQDLDSGGVIVADKIDVTVTVASPRPPRP
jgi:polyisoprenoid-binding protein YceI